MPMCSSMCTYLGIFGFDPVAIKAVAPELAHLCRGEMVAPAVGASGSMWAWLAVWGGLNRWVSHRIAFAAPSSSSMFVEAMGTTTGGAPALRRSA